LRDGIKDGERIAKEIIEKAREESIKILKEKEEEIRKERQKALKGLESRIIDLSVIVASKAIGRSLSNEDHVRIINEFVSQTRNLDLLYDRENPQKEETRI